MMNAISHTDTTQFRRRLAERASQLRDEIRATLLRSDQERYFDLVEKARDLADDAFADLMVDINLAEVDRDIIELREVDAALQRLTDGSYGVCATCNEAIEHTRLKVNPSAARCLSCQSAFERAHQMKTPSL